MYNKIKEIFSVLSPLTVNDLKEEGIRAIIILAANVDFEGCAFTKGELPDVLALIGIALSRASKVSGIPLKDLLKMIEKNERR